MPAPAMGEDGQTDLVSQQQPSFSLPLCTVTFSLWSGVISLVFLSLLLISVVGNSFVILTIVYKRHLAHRSVTNLFLVNLAVADLLRSFACIPTTLLSMLTECWVLGPFMCKLVAFLQPVGVCSSAYTLAVIAIERYYAICRPLESRKWHTKRRALWMLSFVWILSLSTNSFSLILFDAIPHRSHWACQPVYSSAYTFAYQFYITLVFLFVPLTLMVVLYGIVIYRLNKAIQKNDSRENSETNTSIISKLPVDRSTSISEWFFSIVRPVKILETEKTPESGRYLKTCSARSSPRCSYNSPYFDPSKITSSPVRSRLSSNAPAFVLRSSNQERILLAKRQVTRMLITLVILFAACWTPSYFWWLVVRGADYFNKDVFNKHVNTMLTLLTYISSCTNPVTYCFMNKRCSAASGKTPSAESVPAFKPIPRIRINFDASSTSQ